MVIIQARLSSTRLPGKVLKKVLDKPLLWYLVERVKKAKEINNVVIATTTNEVDGPIVEFAKTNGIDFFRGSETDVLDRYYKAALEFRADIIVRVTSDCPLIDPKVIDDTVRLYKNSKVQYAANTVPPETSKYPDGSDVEVFGIDALKRAYEESKDPLDREHVTFYFWRHDNGFKTAQLDHHNNYSKYRFTVDYPEDLDVIEFIIKELKKRNNLGHVDEIVEILDANPKIKAKNSRYYFGIGWKR